MFSAESWIGLVFFVRRGEIVERPRRLGCVFDVVTIKVDESEKKLHFATSRRLRPVSENLQFRGIWVYSSGGNQRIHIHHLIAKQETHRRFQLQFSRTNSLVNSAQVIDMIRSRLREDNHVIQIRQSYMTDNTLQDAGHQPLVGGRCVAQFKKHLDHFVEPDMHYEGILFDVNWFDRHLVIGHRQVESAEHSGSSERVKSFIESGQREQIELCDRIQAPIVDTHLPAAVFLPDNDDW